MSEKLLDRLQTPVAVLDTCGAVTAANRAFRALVPADPIGASLDTLFETLDWQEVLASSLEQSCTRTLARDGHLFSTVFTREDDELVAEFSQHTEDDFPDLIQTRRLLSALEQTDEMIVVTDGAARIVYVNPAFERVMGYSRDEVLGGHNRMWRSGAHDDAFYEEAWLKIQRGEIWRGQLINRRRDGSLVYEDTSISRVTDSRGEVLGYVTIKRDVTAQRELEETLARAQRMESVGTLAGGVAHDFNNVLQAILGSAELLLERSAGDVRLAPLARQIKDAAEQSASLTSQLLAFARRQVVTPRPLDPRKQIERSLELLRRLIGSGIALHWSPDVDTWPVVMDPSQLGQIVTNICINARDAIGDVGTIRVSTANLPAADCANLPIPPNAHRDYVCVRISDDGTGMNAETLERIFEPFYTTKKPGEGTGLGLSTVYGIVAQNGGQVFAESAPHAGTTLAVYLPRHEGPAPEPEMTDAHEPSASARARILVVEDEPPIQRLMQLLLEKGGYEVVACTDPEAALEAVEAETPVDLVISDVIMPGMNGRDLVAALRQRRPELPALFVSGYTADILEGLSEADKTRCFLQKPFKSAALLERVEDLLAD